LIGARLWLQSQPQQVESGGSAAAGVSHTAAVQHPARAKEKRAQNRHERERFDVGEGGEEGKVRELNQTEQQATEQ
jgi:hypothetical protein